MPLSLDAVSVAAGADYNVPLGRRRRVMVGAGIGQKLLIAPNRFREGPCSFLCFDVNARLNPGMAYYPYVRAVAGAAF